MNMPFTTVPRCIGSNANTHGLKHLYFPDMGASGGLPDGARLVHRRMDELLTQQNSISDGETTPVYERSQHPQTLCHFLSA